MLVTYISGNPTGKTLDVARDVGEIDISTGVARRPFPEEIKLFERMGNPPEVPDKPQVKLERNERDRAKRAESAAVEPAPERAIKQAAAPRKALGGKSTAKALGSKRKG